MRQLIVFLLLLFPLSLSAQTSFESDALTKGMQSIDSLTVSAKRFIDKPNAENKALLQDAIRTYEKSEESLRKAILDQEIYALEKELEDILAKNSDDREQLKKELIYWKFKEEELGNEELLNALTTLKEKSEEIHKSFKKKKDYHDSILLYMAEEAFKTYSVTRNQIVEVLFKMDGSAKK